MDLNIDEVVAMFETTSVTQSPRHKIELLRSCLQTLDRKVDALIKSKDQTILEKETEIGVLKQGKKDLELQMKTIKNVLFWQNGKDLLESK